MNWEKYFSLRIQHYFYFSLNCWNRQKSHFSVTTPSASRSWNDFHRSSPTHNSAVCFMALPWTMAKISLWVHSDCIHKMSSQRAQSVKITAANVRIWYQRGSHMAAKWQSPFSKPHFWEDFHLHWHLGQNRMTFELWAYVGRGSDMNVSDGLDGIQHWYKSYSFKRDECEKTLNSCIRNPISSLQSQIRTCGW